MDNSHQVNVFGEQCPNQEILDDESDLYDHSGYILAMDKYELHGNETIQDLEHESEDDDEEDTVTLVFYVTSSVEDGNDGWAWSTSRFEAEYHMENNSVTYRRYLSDGEWDVYAVLAAPSDVLDYAYLYSERMESKVWTISTPIMFEDVTGYEHDEFNVPYCLYHDEDEFHTKLFLHINAVLIDLYNRPTLRFTSRNAYNQDDAIHYIVDTYTNYVTICEEIFGTGQCVEVPDEFSCFLIRFRSLFKQGLSWDSHIELSPEIIKEYFKESDLDLLNGVPFALITTPYNFIKWFHLLHSNIIDSDEYLIQSQSSLHYPTICKKPVPTSTA
jgi:hypothetical protein